ncbi:MAG: hypothetical protein ACRCT1_05740 [Microcoleaceae cyanobacterium]
MSRAGLFRLFVGGKIDRRSRPYHILLNIALKPTLFKEMSNPRDRKTGNHGGQPRGQPRGATTGGNHGGQPRGGNHGGIAPTNRDRAQ